MPTAKPPRASKCVDVTTCDPDCDQKGHAATCTKCSPVKSGTDGKSQAPFITKTESFMQDEILNLSTKPMQRAINAPRPRRASWSRGALMPNMSLPDGQQALKAILVLGGSKDKLGQGSYGSVQKVKYQDSGLVRALKTIGKEKIDNLVRLKREILIMKMLDHPGCVRLHEIFESPNELFLVMEALNGGELFDEIVRLKSLSERATASIMKQLLSAVAYIHSQAIVHRDLKPENLIFTCQDKETIKVIDWGFALKCAEGHKFNSVVGTPYYVAPEVLFGSYDKKCDIWSCGVVMYILLCGYPPFYGNDNKEILRKVKLGEFFFDPKQWKNISEHAKDLVRRFLCYDPNYRPDAENASKHPWLIYYTNLTSVATKAQSQNRQVQELAERMMRFSSFNELKQFFITMAAMALSPSMQTSAFNLYQMIDEEGKGYLDPVAVLTLFTTRKIPVNSELKAAVYALDTDGNSSIDYTEFLTVATDDKNLFSSKVLLNVYYTLRRLGSMMTDTQQEDLSYKTVERLLSVHSQSGTSKTSKRSQALKLNLAAMWAEATEVKPGNTDMVMDERQFLEYMKKGQKSSISSRAASKAKGLFAPKR